MFAVRDSVALAAGRLSAAGPKRGWSLRPGFLVTG